MVHLARVVVTKAGGMTISECLAKGAAMVLTKPVPGQETYNTRAMCDRGAAVGTRSARQVLDQVARLLRCPEESARLQRNARRLFRPATDIIVSRVLEMVAAWQPQDE